MNKISEELKKDLEQQFIEMFIEAGNTITTVDGYKDEILEWVYRLIEITIYQAERRKNIEVSGGLEALITICNSDTSDYGELGYKLDKKFVVNSLRNLLIEITK